MYWLKIHCKFDKTVEIKRIQTIKKKYFNRIY